MERKIGIITFHRSYNYGSVLQAYAMQHFLNAKLNIKAELIDYIMKSDFEQYRLFRTALYKRQPKSFLADLVYLRKNLKRKHSFEKFLKEYIPLSKNTYTDPAKLKELNSEYTDFICGSDQIWNTNCTKGVDPGFFLGFADSSKKTTAYAPSIADTDLSPEHTEKMREYIGNIDFLSVREEATVPVLRSYTDKPVEVVLDPTMLLDCVDYQKIISLPDEKNYIFMYILEGNDQIIEYTNKLAKEKNLKIIYISKKDRKSVYNGKNVYGCSPNEFLGYIKNADYAVTNSFHATVFSVLFQKQFCTFKTKYSFWRMVDLLTKLGLSQRIYGSLDDIDSKIDYKSVEQKLDKLKNKSINYLKKCLE